VEYIVDDSFLKERAARWRAAARYRWRDTRPAEKIAKLFPPVDPLKHQKDRARPPEASAAPNSKDVSKAADV
jgi:hypothetical protein